MGTESIFCLDCDYPLAELRSSGCPECGREFDLDDGTTFRWSLATATTVFSTPDQAQGHLIRYLLEVAGIPALAITNNLILGELARIEVQVSRFNCGAAKRVIADYEAERRRIKAEGRGVSWQCADCGEEVDAVFEICWNCQAEKTGEGGRGGR